VITYINNERERRQNTNRERDKQHIHKQRERENTTHKQRERKQTHINKIERREIGFIVYNYRDLEKKMMTLRNRTHLAYKRQ